LLRLLVIIFGGKSLACGVFGVFLYLNLVSILFAFAFLR